MAKLFNLARMSTATTGTGTITLGSAISGFLSFASAGVADGDVVTYAISDGAASEIGRGTYTSSGTTLSRDTILTSTNSGSAISLSGTAQVIVTASAEDLEGRTKGYNFLSNGGMRIWQRGTSLAGGTSNANDVYTADRWILLSGDSGGKSNDVVDVSRDTSDRPDGAYASYKMDVQTASKKFGICQILEARDSGPLLGKIVTLSFYAKVNSAAAGRLDNIKAVILSWSSTADTVTSDVVSGWGAEDTTPTWATNWTAENTPANIGVTTSWARCSVSGTIDTSSATNVAVLIWSDGFTGTVSDTLHLANVKLEIGDVASDYSEVPLGEDLIRCSRYFRKSFAIDTTPAQNAGTVNVLATQGFSATTNAMSMTVDLYPVMFASPTVTTYNPSAANNQWRNASNSSDIPSATIGVGSSSFGLYIAGAATVGHTYYIHYTAEAEL